MFLQFSERLRKTRELLGVTQDDMSARLKVSKRSYCAYEAGDTAPSAKLLTALAENGVDVAYLLTGIRAAAPALAVEPEREGYSVEVLSKEEQALLDNYRHCPKDGQDAIKATSAALAQPKCNKKAG